MALEYDKKEQYFFIYQEIKYEIAIIDYGYKIIIGEMYERFC
jgi:hypothetical protein